MTTPQLPEMIAHVQAKASRDADFRAAFLKAPKATVELEFGVTLPPEAEVIPVPLSPDAVVVMLEPLASEDGALSDADLESVAGGSKAGARDFFGGIGGAITSGVGAVVVGGAGTVVAGPVGVVAGSAVSAACSAGAVAANS